MTKRASGVPGHSEVRASVAAVGNQIIEQQTRGVNNTQQPRKEVIMSDQEKQQFGNRCPEGYKKMRILGK